MGTITCNGISINYRQIGDGRDIVLIHGLAANHGFWHLRTLLPLARKYTVMTYDLRGHGYSGMPMRGYTSLDMACDLHALLNHLKIEKTHLVGHSLGGLVAIQYAVRHPERIFSLTVADSRVHALQPTQYAKEWPNWHSARIKLAELGLSIPEGEPEAGLWLLEKLAEPEWRSARKKLDGSPLFIPFGRWGGGDRSAYRWLQLLRNTTARKDLTCSVELTADKLSMLRIPTLLMYGEKSPVLPSFQGLKHSLPNCKSIIISGAGHFFPAIQPEIFANNVMDFLEEIEAKERRKYTRFLCRLPIRVAADGSSWMDGVTLNVSENGLLFEGIKDFEVGSTVLVASPLLKSAQSQSVMIKGRIVRCSTAQTSQVSRIAIELVSERIKREEWRGLLALARL